MRTLRLTALLLLFAFSPALSFAAVPNVEVLPGDTFALGAPTYVNNYALTANTAKTITIPTNARFAFFGANGDFYANYTTTAVVPASDVTDGSGGEINPQSRYVGRLSTFSVIAPNATKLTIAWYR